MNSVTRRDISKWEPPVTLNSFQATFFQIKSVPGKNGLPTSELLKKAMEHNFTNLP